MFKAKAEAEKKKMQAQGMKAGQDFVDGEFPSALPGKPLCEPGPR